MYKIIIDYNQDLFGYINYFINKKYDQYLTDTLYLSSYDMPINQNTLTYGKCDHDKKNSRCPIYMKLDKSIYIDDFKINILFTVDSTIKALNYNTIQHKICTIESDNLDNINQFLKNAFEYSVPTDSKKIKVYQFNNNYWSNISKLDKRNIDTIFIKNEIKDELINDITFFLNNKSEYNKFGIPYKRNYLFAGIPGSGKTSLIFAIASYFNFDISIMNFTAKTDDVVFSNAIRQLNNNSILVLEDIDALFHEREKSETATFLTFSGLINILDGLARREGLIIFMTTNHLEKLDNALIRPGRVDKYYEFTYVTPEQIKNMFNYYFIDQNHKSDEFIEFAKNYQISTAFLQTFFFNILVKNNIMHKNNIKLFKKLYENSKPETDNSKNMYL